MQNVCCFLRNAKKHILGRSRVSGAAGDAEKTSVFADDSVFEETIIAEYALVINGHSLVRNGNKRHFFLLFVLVSPFMFLFW